MTLSDNDISSNNIVTWDIAVSKIRQRTWEIIRDRNMGYWHLLKLTFQCLYKGNSPCHDATVETKISSTKDV